MQKPQQRKEENATIKRFVGDFSVFVKVYYAQCGLWAENY